MCTSANEDLDTLAEYDPLTGYEPNDYHISETTEPYIHESSVENGSLNDLEHDDVTIGMALSSPLFTQEREEPAGRRPAYHSFEESLSSSQSSSVGHRTGETQRERKKRSKWGREREKKSEILGGPADGVPASGGPGGSKPTTTRTTSTPTPRNGG